jgi:hypothetical protein
MSRGLGKIQTLILDALRIRTTPTSAADLRERHLWEIWDPDSDPEFEVWNTAERRRSLRMSMGRALRQLEAAGQIKRDGDGNWYPSGDWTGRDNAERERASTAYHEAGHAVVGLALKMPIAFVTIKPNGTNLGHVSQAPKHYSVGEVYARGSYRKPIADASNQDAFGNPVAERDTDWHADAVMCIAGGMAQTEFLKDGSTWRELEGTRGDRRSVAFARGKLGDKARSIEEYEAECEKLIKQHWPLIEAVAAKLLKEETLSGTDVYGICWRAKRNVVRRQHLKTRKRATP